MRVSPSLPRPRSSQPRGALSATPAPLRRLRSLGRPASPPPPFSHLLQPDQETGLFRWLIVKGFDLQLTPGQDFLSTNPALFKHKNTLPSSLPSVILIPPRLTPLPASESRLHPSELGADAWAAGSKRCPGNPRPLPRRARGDAAEGRLVTGSSLVPADPDPRLRGSVLGLPLGPPGAGSLALGETGGGEQGQREGWSREKGKGRCWSH